VAIGRDVGEFAPTPAFLASVSEATEGSSYRMTMDVTVTMDSQGETFEASGTFMQGATDGQRTSMTVRLGDPLALLDDPRPDDEASAPFGADPTVDMIIDGTTLLVRAPSGAWAGGTTVGGAGPGEATAGALAGLGDGWGRVDLGDTSPGEATAAGGGTPSDPAVYLDAIASGTGVHEIGAETLDGVETRGLGATVTYAEVLAAQGIDVGAVREETAAAGSGDGFAEVADQLLALEIPLEAWVDDGGRLRRISMELDVGEVLASAASVAFPGHESERDLWLTYTSAIDLTDHRDPSIEIDVPTDTADLTDEYLELIHGGTLGAALDAPSAPGP
jgi:hypothetical protein